MYEQRAGRQLERENSEKQASGEALPSPLTVFGPLDIILIYEKNKTKQKEDRWGEEGRWGDTHNKQKERAENHVRE